MPKKVVKRKKKGGLTNAVLTNWINQFVAAKEVKATAEARYKETRDRLDEAVEEYGYVDADGHMWLDAPGDLDIRVKRERRVSQSLDEDALWELIERKGLKRSRFVKTIEVLDQDAVHAALYVDDPAKDGITEAEMDAVLVQRESWAMKVVE